MFRDLNWDGEERMKMLCVRASGLFIWAVTVVKFFQEQLRQSDSEHERLNVLLDVINDAYVDEGKPWKSPTVKTNTKTHCNTPGLDTTIQSTDHH